MKYIIIFSDGFFSFIKQPATDGYVNILTDVYSIVFYHVYFMLTGTIQMKWTFFLVPQCKSADLYIYNITGIVSHCFMLFYHFQNHL